jgi:hypothetical protein
VVDRRIDGHAYRKSTGLVLAASYHVIASAVGYLHFLERLGLGQNWLLNVPELFDFYFAANASRCCFPESPISSQTAFESTQMW